MTSLSTEQSLEELRSLVMDEQRTVTGRWLAIYMHITAVRAQELLQEFIRVYGQNLLIAYYLCGRIASDRISATIVPAAKLSEAMKGLKHVSSVQIYSVCTFLSTGSVNRDSVSAALWAAGLEHQLKIGTGSPEDIAQELHSYSSISCNLCTMKKKQVRIDAPIFESSAASKHIVGNMTKASTFFSENSVKANNDFLIKNKDNLSLSESLNSSQSSEIEVKEHESNTEISGENILILPKTLKVSRKRSDLDERLPSKILEDSDEAEFEDDIICDNTVLKRMKTEKIKRQSTKKMPDSPKERLSSPIKKNLKKIKKLSSKNRYDTSELDDKITCKTDEEIILNKTDDNELSDANEIESDSEQFVTSSKRRKQRSDPQTGEIERFTVAQKLPTTGSFKEVTEEFIDERGCICTITRSVLVDTDNSNNESETLPINGGKNSNDISKDNDLNMSTTAKSVSKVNSKNKKVLSGSGKQTSMLSFFSKK